MATKPSLDAIRRQSEQLKRSAAKWKRERLSDDEIRRREMARRVIDRLKNERVSDHDKAIIRELGESKSVNFVARKMELDLVLTAAIIARVV